MFSLIVIKNVSFCAEKVTLRVTECRLVIISMQNLEHVLSEYTIPYHARINFLNFVEARIPCR